jgi:serine/threonine protein kinase
MTFDDLDRLLLSPIYLLALSSSIGRPADSRIRFYAAEVCLALKWIHGKSMIYRALSLDHILLGPDGHIKLIDFVISKVGLEPGCRTRSFCGQASYMAPEVSTSACKIVESDLLLITVSDVVGPWV